MAGEAQKLYSLSGVWQLKADDGILHSIRIPGTLEENNIGHPDTGAIDLHKSKSGSFPKSDTDRFLLNENMLSKEEPAGPAPEPVWTRFTRRSVYEGTVRISRMLDFEEKRGRRYFLEIERARFLKLLIDDEEVEPIYPVSLSAPQVFEVTGRIDGSHMLTIVSDNSYEKGPREEILHSNAASDDTATNWNGLLGYVRIREELPAFISRLLAYEKPEGLYIDVTIDSDTDVERRLVLTSGALLRRSETEHVLHEGINRLSIGPLTRSETFSRWSIDDPKCYTLTALLLDPEAPLTRVSEREVRVGFRSIEAKSGGIFLNGRQLFLIGEENRSVHPETVYPPMERTAWKRLFGTYRAYGLNFAYFRTHVPPEEAFDAADETGFFLFVELPRGTRSEDSSIGRAKTFYENETERIFEAYGHHPSFLGLSAAGSPDDEKGQAALTERLLKTAEKCTVQQLLSAGIDLDSKAGDLVFKTEGAELITTKPVVTFHTAMHEMLPDFGELDLFSGLLKAEQLSFAERYVESTGAIAYWKKYVEASGESMAADYRASIRKRYLEETSLGFVFYSLQDYLGANGRPGGMMFSHPIPKPYAFADPKKISSMLGMRKLLIQSDRVSFDTNETLKTEVILRDFTLEPVSEPFFVRLTEPSTGTDLTDALTFSPFIRRMSDTSYALGEVTITFRKVPVMQGRMVPVRLSLRYRKTEAEFDFYAVPAELPVCPDTVLETRTLSDQALRHLKEGGTVFFTPEVRNLPYSRPFYVAKDSALLKPLGFESYSDERFGALKTAPGIPLSDRFTPFFTILKHPFDGPLLTPLFETNMGGGQLVVSLLNLKDRLSDRTVRMLLKRLYDYMDSYDFSPNREIRPEELALLFGEMR